MLFGRACDRETSRMILVFWAWMTERMELPPTTIWNVIHGAYTAEG